ncbi:alginate lyase family protein [Duganella sp. sic0402]|uniref:alginate lyase family protein n=1 Tax=Duganella sp. sic0402 TaxID=2854786 RepID=UPI001C452931|nr:alginate lyase family protein [Duganella sp. sic0402]MBV7539269.1 alginate lyase family protein [Duganella sp. sic0402]
MKLFIPLLLAVAAPLAQACDAPPPARSDIEANSYYSDKNHSVIDPVKRAQNIANTKPVEDFLIHVAQDANGRDAGCALSWLANWAEQKALLGKMSSEQAFYVRKWTLSGMALNYARVKPQATPAQRVLIEGWFKSLADATIAHADAKKGTRNNHYYWEGLAVTATGGVTGDARYLDWGRKVLQHALGQMAPDGALPAEMERAVKALHYQVYAATPLVMIASILDVRDPRLDTLVAFTVAGSADPSGIAKRTGFEQEPVGSREVTTIYNRQVGKPPPPAGKALWQPRLGGSLDVPNPLEHLK